ncbi:YciI family protein [Cellulomonas cellasea]|uniref:YciI family protein n=1 Tax=Cellulomonas cellasea TaxID=43670 RepID=UPI0025A48B86|nr:YciI family protein [Cellulomonas cellasea]MDM8084082.1 YciI family protein [Cellulomonas cellasea]
MPTYAVQYAYDDRRDLQDEVRPAHRAYLGGLADQGLLLGSGPYTEGEPGALLVFQAQDRAQLDGLLADDPFAHAGVIATVGVRPWNVVLGPWAAQA